MNTIRISFKATQTSTLNTWTLNSQLYHNRKRRNPRWKYGQKCTNKQSGHAHRMYLKESKKKTCRKLFCAAQQHTTHGMVKNFSTSNPHFIRNGQHIQHTIHHSTGFHYNKIVHQTKEHHILREKVQNPNCAKWNWNPNIQHDIRASSQNHGTASINHFQNIHILNCKILVLLH